MRSLKDGWYVAGADGVAAGPMTRAEMQSASARGGFPPDALVWHVEIAEWRPLSAAALASPAADAARSATSAQSTLAERVTFEAPHSGTRPSPPKQSAAQRRAQAQQRRQGSASHDDGQRLLSASAAERKQAMGAMKPAAASASAPGQAAHPGALRSPAPILPGRAGAKTAAKDTNPSGVAALECLRRFIARAIDTLTLGVVGAMVVWHYALRTVEDGPELPHFLLGAPTPVALWLLAFAAMVPLDALMLAIAGTTPGKALLGLRVTASDGARPSPAAAVQRALGVYVRGLGLGIPFLAFFTLPVAGARRMNHGRTRWDEGAKLMVVAAPLSGGRWQLALVAFIAAWVAVSSGLWEQLLYGSGLLH
jgi:hypothetical protein